MFITVILKDICDFYHSSFGVLWIIYIWRMEMSMRFSPSPRWFVTSQIRKGLALPTPVSDGKKHLPEASHPFQHWIRQHFPFLPAASHHNTFLSVSSWEILYALEPKGLWQSQLRYTQRGTFSFSAGSHIPPVAGGTQQQRPNTALSVSALGPTPR